MRYVAVALLALVGCEHATRMTVPSGPARAAMIGVPDPSYRMSAAEREDVGPEFDADALERLLSMFPPEARPRIFAKFRKTPQPGERGYLTGFSDPRLQAALEDVWAPYWRDVPTELLSRTNDPIPGREKELARRRAAGKLIDP